MSHPLLKGNSCPLASARLILRSNIIASLMMGLFGAIADTLWSVLQQEYVPADKLGRVSSISMIAASFIWPIGYFLVGGFSDIVGVAIVIIVGGTLSAAIRCYGLTVRDKRGTQSLDSPGSAPGRVDRRLF